MGNFGKRILVIFLCVIALVTFTLVGNAYQQSEKIHKISNGDEVVFVYNGLDITKNDLYEQMININTLSSVETYFLEEVLLKSVIEGIDDSSEAVSATIEYLTFGDSKDELSDDEIMEKEESFAYTCKLANKTAEEYAKVQLARMLYAKYRLTSGLEVGGKTYDISYDAINKEYKEGNGSAYALALKFYTSDDFNQFIKDYNEIFDTQLTVVSSELRVFKEGSGDDSKWLMDYSSATANNNFQHSEKKHSIKTIEVTYLKDTQTYSQVESISASEAEYDYVPNVLTLAQDGDGNYIKFKYIEKDNSEDEDPTTYEYFVKSLPENEGEVGVLYKWDSSNKVWKSYANINYVEQDESHTYSYFENSSVSATTCSGKWTNGSTSISKDYTLEINADEMLDLYVKFFNLMYQKNIAITTSISSIQGSKTDDEFSEALRKEGFAKVNIGTTEEPDYIIAKYYGDSEYQIKTESGNLVGTFGTPEYVLDDNDKKIENENKVEFTEDTVVTLANSIKASNAQLFSLYLKLNKVDSEIFFYDYDERMEGLSSSNNRYSVIDEIFDLSDYDFYKSGKVVNSGTPYYMIYKFGNVEREDLDKDSLEYKDLYIEKLDYYLKDTTFVEMCISELFKECKLKFFDSYLAYSYDQSLQYNSSSNVYGVEETKDYYKSGLYSAKNIAKIRKAISFEVSYLKSKDSQATTIKQEVNKDTLTADKLYESEIKRNSTIHLANAVLNKVLFNMEENVQLHGTEQYLKSDNWKVKQYADEAETVNLYYEYGYYSYYYGYDFENISQCLYGLYGVRTYDELVEAYQKNSNRQIYLYEKLTGSSNLYEATSTVDNLLSELFDKAIDYLTYSNGKFTFAAGKEYYSVDYAHILAYQDENEDDVLDEYSTENKIDDDILDELYSDILDTVYEKGTTSSTYTTNLSTYVTDFKAASRFDVEASTSTNVVYSLEGKIKAKSIQLKYESAELDSFSESSYAQGFRDCCRSLAERLETVDKDLTGYSICNNFATTEFGEHFIIATPCEECEYNEISISDLNKYMELMVYESIFGTTEEAEDYAKEYRGEEYATPVLNTKLKEFISTNFSTELNLFRDSSKSYCSTYIILNEIKAALGSNNATNKADLTLLIDDILPAYETALGIDE